MTCPYCEERKSLFENVGYNDNTIYIKAGKLCLINLPDMVKVEIRYCPICGMELEGK